MKYKHSELWNYIELETTHELRWSEFYWKKWDERPWLFKVEISFYRYSLSLISALLFVISTMYYHIFILCLVEPLCEVHPRLYCLRHQLQTQYHGPILHRPLHATARCASHISRLQSSLHSCLHYCVLDFSSILSSRQMRILYSKYCVVKDQPTSSIYCMLKSLDVERGKVGL